jgi:DNA polymerase (family 10)
VRTGGEIEAALDGALPDVVELADLRGDLHMHTDLTDGLAPAADMVAAAEARGYRHCAITDHAPGLAMQRMTRDKALEQRVLVRDLTARYRIEVLHGSELNIAEDGSLDWEDVFLAGFDLLVASVHSHFDQPAEVVTRRLIAAIEHPHGNRPRVNAFPDRLDLDDALARRAREDGVVFAIDTDAHSVLHLDHMRFGVATAQRGWVETRQVTNTWPLGRLRRFLAAGRQLARI